MMKIVHLPIQIWMVVLFMFLGFLLHVISFCVPSWNKLPQETLGLWQRCPSTGCVAVTGDYLGVTMQAGRALQVLGLICYITLIIGVFAYICWRSDIKLLSGAIVLCFLIMSCNIIGSLLWASVSNTTIYWAYYLSYISGLSVSTSGGILVYVRRQKIITESPI